MVIPLNSINVSQCYKTTLMAMFEQLQISALPLFKLNFGVIAFLPKNEDASRIEQYKPICLLNANFKIFTNVGTNRITSIAQSLVQLTQADFMPDRYFFEGVVVLQETIHELHINNGALFKIDFQNTYDKVNWCFFIQKIVRMKGFAPK
jgi:hypothetical protein